MRNIKAYIPFSPFSIASFYCAQGHGGQLESLPAVTEWRLSDSLDKSPLHRRATSIDKQPLTLTYTPTDKGFTFRVTYIFLDCNRKSRNLERTHAARQHELTRKYSLKSSIWFLQRQQLPSGGSKGDDASTKKRKATVNCRFAMLYVHRQSLAGKTGRCWRSVVIKLASISCQAKALPPP